MTTGGVDWSKFELYQPPIEEPARRPARPRRHLSHRCPKEIRAARSLKIERGADCSCEGHDHFAVVINGLSLCPVSAILFMAAAKDYIVTDGLNAAVSKVIKEAYES